MRTTSIMNDKQKVETIEKATKEIIRFFSEDCSFAEMQSCLLEGAKTMLFSIEPENPYKAEDFGKMLQAGNDAMKLLRPFASALGQTE